MKIHVPARDADGKLPKYAWPGGYPLYYIFEQECATCCADCANGANGSEASETSDDPQWKIVDSDVNYEQDMHCDHCGAKIESAYGVTS